MTDASAIFDATDSTGHGTAVERPLTTMNTYTTAAFNTQTPTWT
jgi:hypothetical protein